MVEDLLKFARSTRTKKALVDLNESLAEVASLLAHQFELDKVALHTEFDPSLPQIVADAEKLKQVFHESVDECEAAISGKGEIVVRTSKESSGDRASGICDRHPDAAYHLI